MHEAYLRKAFEKKKSYLLAYHKLFTVTDEKTIMTLLLAISLASARNLIYYCSKISGGF